MSTELKQAAQQALKELDEARKIIRASSSRQLAKDWDRRATAVLADLRAAIQQAESEPVAWMASYVDPIGNDHVYVTSHHDLAVENDMHGTPRPLYTHPAPGVPEGFALVPLKATPKVAMVLYEGARGCFSPKVAEDLWQDALTAALPAMPLAASPVQKGGE